MRPKTPVLPEPEENTEFSVEEFQENQNFFGSEENTPELQSEKSDSEDLPIPKISKQPSKESNRKNIRQRAVFSVWKYIEILPGKYRSQPHKSILETIIKDLNNDADGLSLQDIMRATGSMYSKSILTEYLNILADCDIVIKTIHRGILYSLNRDLKL
ncbi:hypothetical protein BB560_006947 [Smittium megazygosporum]|uniref:Uncharacterized protein n=1 Tax=Smittium megazygosporum TaxID=133381 RepID=A0A2T9Y048_9FUNG|nr:hypothetical protein BB560_006947 [Smittium megazygosporum]